MKYFIYLLIFALWLLPPAQAQSPKRELRAAWIATVANIDWPAKQGLSSEEQQQQFISRLEKLKKIGCNAVIVQIRPCCDACYPSDIEPWSHFLTGQQGQAPTPYYDPLEFMIAETHKRNMEFHAWFNPFRALMDCRKNPNPPSHVTRAHSPWIIAYGGKSYLDPGIPEARNYVVNVIKDVVERYDIDAVHLDDYFYPYRIGKTPFNDKKSYTQYGKGMDKENWRRDNVNKFIAQLSKTIRAEKPYIKLGISPFGVWRNSNRDPAEGSETHAGQTCYDDLYADVLLWMKKGWIDYLMPQLYWEHANHAAAFGTLLEWWNNHSYGRHIYYGLGVYHLSEPKSHYSVKEMMWQLNDIRAATSANSGYSFYSAISFDKIGPAFANELSGNFNRYPALPPRMPWIDSIAPEPPVVSNGASGKTPTTLKWTQNNPQKEPLKFVVYRFAANEPVNLDRTDRIISIQQETQYTDPFSYANRHSTYIVTTLDRLWNESKPSNKVVGD